MSEVTPVVTKNSFFGLRTLGIALLVVAGLWSGFDHYRQVAVKVAGMESEISEQTKKDALYELSAITNKLKVQGIVTDKFSKLESANVKTNMDSQRSVTMGVMSILGSDLRSVGMPTNGLMELKYSNEFFKTLMDSAGNEYGRLKEILQARAQKIKEYEMFMADPLNRIFAGWAGYPHIDLKAEKAWTLLTDTTKKANDTGVADPVNPLGKNNDISE
jgi:hypothetical protein